MTLRLRKMSHAERKAWTGFFYVLPWFIGFIYFFADPFIRSLIFSVSDVELTVGGAKLTFVGLQNYRFAFTGDSVFVRELTASLRQMATNTPLIVIYSLFIATVLNQRFVGRLFARAVFFMPVIIASGVVISILRGDAFSRSVISGERVSALFEGGGIGVVLLRSGLPVEMIQFIQQTVNSIFELSWRSGIQILIFLAALQTIPRSMYEAASMEGATAWESFWKITFPLISPMVLVNIVYTIIDAFVDVSNPAMNLIAKYSRDLRMAYSSALSWIYFPIVFAVIMIVYSVMNRRIFYRVD
jgi:ABC-type sugar transport system permease subunit